MRSTILAVALALLAPSLAHAEGLRRPGLHPRRAQVNARLRRENARIRKGQRSGALTKEQAVRLHGEVRAVRQEERTMAAQHGGHLTRAEQRGLNREENRISREIREERRQ